MKHSKKATKTETVIGSSVCSIIVLLTFFNGVTRTRVTTVEQKQEVAAVQEEYSFYEYDMPLLMASLPKSSGDKFSPIMFDLEGDYESIEELKLNKELKKFASIRILKNPLAFHFLEGETETVKSIEKIAEDASEESEEVEETESDEEESEEVEEMESDEEESEEVEETESDEEDSEEVEETESDEEDSEHEVESDKDLKYAEESKAEVANVDNDEEEATEIEVEKNESSSEDPQGEFKDNYSREVQLLAGIMYLEEGIYVNRENGEYIHKLAGSVVLHRVESDIYPDSVEDVLYDPGQYGSRTRRLIETVEIPDIVYVWAQEIYDDGPLGPSNLVFQAGFTQGEVYYEYENQYFCLSKKVS